MRKIIYILLLLLLIYILLSLLGYKRNKIEIIFKENAFSKIINPDDSKTTMCEIKLIGISNCDLKLKLAGSNDVCIEAGKVNFRKNYEWFNNAKRIQIVVKDSCTKFNSNLFLEYRFSKSYFGKGISSGNIDCD